MSGKYRFFEKNALVCPYEKVQKEPISHSECSSKTERSTAPKFFYSIETPKMKLKNKARRLNHSGWSPPNGLKIPKKH
jgi:hypothetical protein